MKKLLLVPVLLVAACGDNLTPDEDQLAGGAVAPESDAPDELELYAALVSEPYSCDDNSVLLRGFAGYSGGPEVDNRLCHFELADGRTFDTCYQVVSLPTAQNVVLTVTDPATGNTATHEEVVTGPALDATLNVSSGGLWIGWSLESSSGFDLVRIDFEPVQNVIIQDPRQQENPFGVVNVTQAGTYTVTATVLKDYFLIGCSKTVEQTIEVACTDEHVQ
jgi:hypothetical protein